MGRAPCCDKNGLNRGPWTPEEDQKLMDYIRKHGPGSWRTLPKNAGLSRCGKSCRLRWANYLRPDIRRGRFSFEEEQTMIQLHSILGNKWSAIAARLPGRTDNEIKNHWNTHIRKRLLRMGIDPATHRPRLDLSSLLNPSSHLGLSSFLGVQPTVGTELLQVAAINLLSAQCQKAELLQQNSLHEQPQQQQQQQQQLSNTLIQYLSQPFFSPDQQLQSSTAQPNLWQNNSMPCASLEDFSAPPVDPGFYGYAPSMCAADPVAEASAFASKGARQSFDFSPAMPTPVSSLTPTHLDSPATDVNSTTITGEDERDSYCSSVLDFQIMPDLLDIGGFM